MMTSNAPTIPVDTRAPIVFGLLIILLGIGGFLLWAILSPLAEAVVATGVIKVDSNRKLIQHLEGGMVTEILVHDGDQVRKGDVLVRLDETRAIASLVIIEDMYHTALAQESRLVAERDESDNITFPQELEVGQADTKISDILQSQHEVFSARRAALQGQLQILRKQIAHLREDIIGIRSQRGAKSRQLKFVKDELTSMHELLQKGLTGKQRVLELEREAARLEGEFGEYQSEIAAAETAISEKELEIFQVRNSFRESVVNELKQVQSEVFDYRERLNAATHTYKHTEVKSPVDGVVVGSGVHTIGGIVGPGATLLEIVPENDELIIEARLNPEDIDNVVPDLPAGVKITAFNQRKTPELSGSVKYVSADSLQDEQTGLTYFLAKIQVPDSEVEKLGDKHIQPGMMAEVFIRTGERTPADYLLEPLYASFRRAWLEE